MLNRIKNFLFFIWRVILELFNLKGYYYIKYCFGIILAVIIFWSFDNFYRDSRLEGMRVTNVVTGLEYLRGQEYDEALRLAITDAKDEIVKWVDEFNHFKIIPNGFYDVQVYSDDSEEAKILYCLHINDEGEIIEKRVDNKRTFYHGLLSFKDGYLSISYPFSDYFNKAFLPSATFQFFIMLLLSSFIVKDKEKIQMFEEAQEIDRFKSSIAMSSGIAHNFRNSLHIISGQLKLIKKESKAKPPSRPFTRQSVIDRIEVIEPSIKDMTDEIDKLLGFTKLDMELVNVDIIDILNTSIKLFKQSYFDNIIIRTDFCRDRINVLGKRQSYITVILNILNNALQATLSEQKIITISAVINKSKLILRFKDNGRGMTAEVRKHIFEPFYTVDKVRGTGLGMSSSKMIIQKFKGDITVEHTELNKGTTIKIELPLVENHEDISS